jgi:1,4-dihydroxy-2-naphthoate octaprenyltransferase
MIPQSIANWMRAIRIRFLLASVIAVSNGVAIAFWKTGAITFSYGILTLAGVICLHISVDLLNDYWDYKRGIDKITKRTKFSGGTGVLTDNILNPRVVYGVGILFLVLGTLIGTFFVVIRGITIAVILVFAVFAIYFYSTNIVNAGLSELFVAIKGLMIVLGSYYVQTGLINPTALFVGIIIGILSASVLFVNSFPDYEADRYGRRRTLVILLGQQNAVKAVPLFLITPYILILVGIFFGYTKIVSLITFASIPFLVKAINNLNKYNEIDKFVSVMAATVMFARITGLLFALSFLL